MEYLVMLPGPTNVPERVTRSMFTHMINHRSKDFVKLYVDTIEKSQKIFDTTSDVVALSASGTGAVEASVVNMVKKGDKVIIPVNGEFSNRLSTMLEWAGANVIRLTTPFGENATFDQVKEAFDNNKDVKAFYVVWNETSTGTMVKYLD
ncbi:MAG: alanine--glyoxylate aminotransferase family protein, partial [Thaumarchaeota archaeon]|nr:alanine--glyoxylate aminotransferase family protein [Nitrososphaerota archaeon]